MDLGGGGWGFSGGSDSKVNFSITLQSVLFWAILTVHVIAGLELTTVVDHSIKSYIWLL